MVIAPEVTDDFADSIYNILETYKTHLNVYCFSAGGTYPFMGMPLKDVDRYSRPGLPAMFRFGSRGVCTSISSDVSSLELYSVRSCVSPFNLSFISNRVARI
jgi:hypothetical protein